MSDMGSMGLEWPVLRLALAALVGFATLLVVAGVVSDYVKHRWTVHRSSEVSRDYACVEDERWKIAAPWLPVILATGGLLTALLGGL